MFRNFIYLLIAATIVARGASAGRRQGFLEQPREQKIKQSAQYYYHEPVQQHKEQFDYFESNLSPVSFYDSNLERPRNTYGAPEENVAGSYVQNEGDEEEEEERGDENQTEEYEGEGDDGETKQPNDFNQFEEEEENKEATKLATQNQQDRNNHSDNQLRQQATNNKEKQERQQQPFRQSNPFLLHPVASQSRTNKVVRSERQRLPQFNIPFALLQLPIEFQPIANPQPQPASAAYRQFNY